MTTHRRLFIIFCIFLLAASFATAAPSFVETRAIFDVDYQAFNEDEETIPESGKITIKNDALSEKTFSLTYSGLLVDYDGDDVTGISVPANDQKEVSFTVHVPHAQDAGETTIGSLVLNSAGNPSQTIPLIQRTKSMLGLKELEIEYVSEDNQQEKDAFDDDDELKTSEFAKPGTNVTIRWTLENFFDNSYDDGTLEDVQLTIEVDDDDLFAEAFTEEYTIGDIDADKKITFYLTFRIADEADAGDYTFDVRIAAEDEKGRDHLLEQDIELNVQRESDDVRIVKAELTPKTITCEEEFVLNLGIKNFGTDDQDLAAVSIYSRTLEINKQVKDIKLGEFDDDDNSWAQRFVFPVPKSVTAGKHLLELRAFVNRDDVEMITNVEVPVGACTLSEEAPAEPAEEPAPETPEEMVEEEAVIEEAEEDNISELFAEGTQQISSSAIISTVENPYTLQDVLVATLLVSIVLALAIITLLFTNLVAPKKAARTMMKARAMEKKAEGLQPEKSDRRKVKQNNREVKRK